MISEKKLYTSDEFWEFSNLPENQNRFFERVRGEIIEVSPSNTYSSAVAMLIGHHLLMFIQGKNLGYGTGEQGGYDLPEETTYAPDVAYISKERQAELPYRGFTRAAPELAVEVVSPGNTASEINRKVLDFLGAGKQLVWVVYPDTRTVNVHTSAGSRTLREDDTLDGGDVLPGFRLRVRDIFP